MPLTTKQLERKRKEDKDTKPESTTKAVPETIDIKARQSEIEKQAEEAKATVREVGRKERRGRELPYKGRRTKGLKGVVSEIERGRKEAQTKGKVVAKAIDKLLVEHEKQLKGVAKYKSDEGYDLVAMIQDGYTTKQLTSLGFNSEVIDKAQSRAGEVAKAEKYKGDTGYDLVAMINDGYTQSQLESLFGKDIAQEGIARASAIDKAAKYKTDTGYDVAAMVRDNFPSKDMAILFESDTITHATEIVKADNYKTETGYDLLAMYDAGYSQGKLKDLAFDAEAVREAYKYHLALEALEPYKTEDGTYDLVEISKAVDKGHIQTELVDLVFGGSPEPLYLTVAQVHQLRLMNYELAKVNAEAWGISVEQLDKIRAAPTDVAANVYAYLQETASESIELTHPSQLPSFQQAPDWKELASALQDIEPYRLEGNEYDVGKAYQAMIDGKLTKASFIVAFGDNTYKDTKAFYNANVEIKPGQWVAKPEWEGLTGAQQKEVIATGKYSVVDTTGLIKLGTGEYIASEDWEKLDETAQSYLKEHGVDKFNAEYTMETAEPSQGWFKDTWAGIKQAMVVTDKTKENATVYCDSWGIKDEKIRDGLAQWIQVSRMFLPRPEADPKTNPKGYLAETGKALAGYAPLIWVVNWKDMSTTDKIINGALDVLILVSLGLGSGLRALKAKPVLRAAKGAGKAADKMGDTLKVLAKTPVDDVAKYTKASSEASKAIQASKVADAKFVTALERVKALTPGQLGKLEKASQIKGLKSAILDISKAQTKLAKAWNVADKTTQLVPGRVNPYQTNIATIQGIANRERALGVLDSIPTAADKVMIRNAGLVIKKIHKGAEYWSLVYDPKRATSREVSKLADAWVKAFKVEQGGKAVRLNIKLGKALQYSDRDIAAYLQDMAVNYKQAGFKLAPWTLADIPKHYRISSVDYIKAMAEVGKSQTALNKALETFNGKLEPRFKVKPTPEFKGFAMDWHKNVLPKLEGGEPIVTPLSSGKSGLRPTLVLEKTKPKLKFKTFYEMKMKPVYETAKEVGEKAVAPIVKGSKVAKTTVAATEAAKAATKVERGIRYGSKAAQRAVEGETTIAIGKVMNATTGKKQPVTAKEWNTQRAIEAITKGAVRTGIDANTRNVTHSQLEELVATDIKQSVRSITDAKLRTQLQPQVKAMTKLVTRLVTKVATKYAKQLKTIRFKPWLRVHIPEAHTKEGRPIYPPGTVVFRMGKTKRGAEYKAMLPPYNQAKLVSSRKPPVGMKRTEGTPSETLTVIGDKKLPFEHISADLGIVDVFVDTKKKRIRFKGGGLQTDVGRRIPGPTRGVSLANTEMRVTREGQIFKTQLRGQKGYSLSRFNPKRGKGRRGRLVRG